MSLQVSEKLKSNLEMTEKPIKVLHVIDVEIDCYIWKNLCEYTDKNIAELVFVTFRNEDSDFTRGMKERGIKVYSLDALQKKQYPKAAKELLKIIKTENPDIIHTHIFYPTLIGVTLAKLKGIKVVVTRHHTDPHHVLESSIKRKFYLSLENYINTRADHLVALSRFGRDILIEKENVPFEKVSLIPNGQTDERFRKITPQLTEKKRAELGMNGIFSIVCTARLFHMKGHKFLFEAVKPLIDEGVKLKVYLVGDGDFQDELEKYVAELGIQKEIQFLGWRNDALEIIGAADLIVHPSLEDALSSAVIESLMLSRPIIAADISGVRDILDDGKYGIIVPPADSKAILSAIRNFLQNPAQANEAAKRGREYILEQMGAEKFANGYIECYRKVLEAN